MNPDPHRACVRIVRIFPEQVETTDGTSSALVKVRQKPLKTGTPNCSMPFVAIFGAA